MVREQRERLLSAAWLASVTLATATTRAGKRGVFTAAILSPMPKLLTQADRYKEIVLAHVHPTYFGFHYLKGQRQSTGISKSSHLSRSPYFGYFSLFIYVRRKLFFLPFSTLFSAFPTKAWLTGQRNPNDPLPGVPGDTQVQYTDIQMPPGSAEQAVQ